MFSNTTHGNTLFKLFHQSFRKIRDEMYIHGLHLTNMAHSKTFYTWLFHALWHSVYKFPLFFKKMQLFLSDFWHELFSRAWSSVQYCFVSDVYLTLNTPFKNCDWTFGKLFGRRKQFKIQRYPTSIIFTTKRKT